MSREVNPYVSMPNARDEPVVLGHLHRSPNRPTHVFDKPIAELSEDEVAELRRGVDQAHAGQVRERSFLEFSDLPDDISAPDGPEAAEAPTQPAVPPA